MADPRPRGSSVFSGLLLIFVGVLLLMHNYRGFELSRVFLHWWPLLLIAWGAVKLYERTGGPRAGQPGAARITGGEVMLVLGLLGLMGIVVGVEQVRERFPDNFGIDVGEAYSDNLDIAPKAVPADARITIRGGRGDITVRASDEPEVRVAGKVTVRGWSESAARRRGEGVSVAVEQNGDGYEVHPTGSGDSRIRVDMDVTVPNHASVTVRNEKGDISVSDMQQPVSVNSGNGDVEIHNTAGDVSIDMRRGDAKISDTQGDVRISGRGEGIETLNASGGLTINGEFVGPIRAERVAKGVRFVSHRTDLTITQLSGHMEAGSGNLEVVDAPGNLSVRSRDEEMHIENVGGKVKVEDRNGNVEVHFSSPPKDDIEIDNASAAITLSLPESSSFEMNADCRSCDEDKGIDSEFSADALKVTNESGNWHLEGKYGTGRRPKITLRTTYGGIAIHKTS
jgi:Putative adhesin/Domain of unknown function (DUF5668)